MAELGWVYFSKEHKETAGTIIKMMASEGMVDELGIGAIRDAFANQLFVGISTVQTRAKYFFIVPYLLYDYQKLLLTTGTNKDSKKYLEDEENKLMWQLRDKYINVDKSGVIGVTLKGTQRIVRRPSSIYWGGIGAYKLINTKGLGVDAFLTTTLSKSKSRLFTELVTNDDNSSDDVDLNFENKLHLHSSINPSENWRANLDIELTKDEAELIYELILKFQPKSLLANILQNEDAQKAINADWCNSFSDFASVAYQLNFSDELLNQIYLAHDFSEIMYGSNLAYNYWLQNDKFKNNDLESAWNAWREELQEKLFNKENFDIDVIINSEFAKTTKEKTKNFIKQWWSLVNSEATIIDTRLLIVKQELDNKKIKARLNYKKWDDVIEGKQIGLGRLNFRFVQAKRIINDILNAKK